WRGRSSRPPLATLLSGGSWPRGSATGERDAGDRELSPFLPICGGGRALLGSRAVLGMIRRRSASVHALAAAAALALAVPGVVPAGGFLEIPRTIDGYPTNVGLLVLGHSTSAQGGYPAKLASALNADAHGLDGRHYVVVNAVTGGDGGLLWSLLSVAAGDPRYDRVRASIGVGVSPVPQWCEDAAGTRWSCRRARLAEVITGDFPIPPTG